MTRIIYTVITSALFLAMLTATKKQEKPPDKHDTPSPRSVPSTTGWQRNEVGGLRFFTPPNATIDRDVSTPTFVSVHLRSDVIVEFRQTPVDFAQQRSDFHAMGEYVYGYYLDAPDAIVAVVWEGGGVGEHCEVTACSAPIIGPGEDASAGTPLCAVRRGMYGIDKLTTADCMAVVAIARSIVPL